MVMLTHAQIWTALDRLAERAGLSPSGLARKAGLDPTTFNKSKRITGGRARAVAFNRVGGQSACRDRHRDRHLRAIHREIAARAAQAVPLLGFAEAGAGGYFDDGGFPVGKGWDEVGLPSVQDEHAYALEISGNSMKPAYRDGDVIVISPGTPIRRGDRVVVKTRDGEVMVKELKRRTAKMIELQSLNPSHANRTLPASDVEWIARIVWASQ